MASGGEQSEIGEGESKLFIFALIIIVLKFFFDSGFCYFTWPNVQIKLLSLYVDLESKGRK